MDGIDLRLLESFVVVAEELHFTRAAERLHLAQPALSQQMRRLEQQVGTPLFEQRRQPVALTAAGAALAAGTGPALHALGRTIAEARGEGPVLRLGHLSSFGPRAVPALATALARAQPGLQLQAHEHSVEEQLRGLRDGTLDAGLLYVDPTIELDATGLTVTPVASGPHYVAMRPDHPAAGRVQVPLADLADEAWILPMGTGTPGYQARFFEALCARHGFTPRIAQQANSIETMLGMVSAGLGIAAAPWTVLLRPPGDLHFAATPGERFDVATVTRAPGVADAFAAVARQVLGDLALSAVPTAR